MLPSKANPPVVRTIGFGKQGQDSLTSHPNYEPYYVAEKLSIKRDTIAMVKSTAKLTGVTYTPEFRKRTLYQGLSLAEQSRLEKRFADEPEVLSPV